MKKNMYIHEDKFSNYHSINSSYSLEGLPFSYDILTYATSKGKEISPSYLVKDLIGVNITVTYDCKWTSQINIITGNGKSMAS